MTKISLIVAADAQNAIGGDNKLLWHIPEDLKFFKAQTLGKPIIMGRKTYESIGRPLPRRTNIVITRDPDWHADGVNVVNTLEGALETAQNINPAEICIIGGGSIYEQALQFATCVYLTRVHKVYNGDTLFPELDPAEWQQVSEREGTECDEIGIRYTFLEYQRR